MQDDEKIEPLQCRQIISLVILKDPRPPSERTGARRPKRHWHLQRSGMVIDVALGVWGSVSKAREERSKGFCILVWEVICQEL